MHRFPPLLRIHASIMRPSQSDALDLVPNAHARATYDSRERALRVLNRAHDRFLLYPNDFASRGPGASIVSIW
jgi:hypothetical protein